MRDTFARTMSELVDTDPNVALVLADIGYGRFVETGAAKRHPDRVINVGIREQAMIGVGAGLAMEGFRPVIHSYTPFLVERPFEQIKLDLVHQGLGAVLVSIGGSVDAPAEGRTHLAPEDVALLSTLPDVDIHVPGHPSEVDGRLRRAVEADHTVYIRLAEATNSVSYPTDGRIRPVKRGSVTAPTVLAIGPMLDPVVAAVRGLDFTVLYTSTVRPLDRNGLRSHATGDIIALVEPYLEGTGMAAVASAFTDVPKVYQAIGVPRRELRKYGARSEHEAAFGLDARSLRNRLAGSMRSTVDVA